jgi:hypothetical protein
MKIIKLTVNLIILMVVLSIIFTATLFVVNFIFGGLTAVVIACAVAVLCLFKFTK